MTLDNKGAERKVFSFAGYSNQPEVKADLSHKITCLGGHVHDGATWSDEVSHVVAANFGQFLEKVIGGLVSGAWVVTKRYIEASYKGGAWANPKAYVCDDLVLRHRERRVKLGPLFHGLKVVFALNNSVQSRVYSRVVRAGGGEVLPYTTIQELLTHHNDIDKLDFVVVDKDKMHELSEWIKAVETKRQSGQWTDLCHIEYKYFFNCITKCNLVNVRDFLVMESEQARHAEKRSCDSVGGEMKRFRRDPVVVDLDSSDDEDVEILEQRLAARSQRRRVYMERGVTGEVINIADSDTEDDEDKDDSGHVDKDVTGNANISLGLQQAISALQPRVISRVRAASDNDNDASEDEIEIVMTKAGESRKTSSVDRRALLFQSRLKEVTTDVNDDVGSISSQSQDDVSSQRSVSPPQEVAVAVDPVPTEPPSQQFPSLEEAWNSKLIQRILDCVVERQTVTGECLSIGGVSLKTIAYDRHSENKVRRTRELVDSSVREEFYQKHPQRSSSSEDDSVVSQLSQVSNIMSSIRFLHHFSSLSCHATPAIVNNLMVEVVRNQSNPTITSQAIHYLKLSLVRQVACVASNIMDRQAWLSSILSSCRHGKVNFDSFDINNKQDVALSTKFFTQLIRDLLRSDTEGDVRLFKLLVDLCVVDIQLLWRPSSKTSSFPLLFHLLGDSPASVMDNVKRLLIPLYISSLRWTRDNSMLRRAITLTALMMAGLDSSNKQSYINCGTKLELANTLAQALNTWLRQQTSDSVKDSESVKGADSVKASNLLWSEMYLLEPDWFVMLVSRSLLSLSSSGSMSRLSSVKQLFSALPKLKSGDQSDIVGSCFQTLLYRTISTCHIHTCLRTFWARALGSDSHVYSFMSRLDRVQERKKEDNKVVRFRSGVTCKVPQILDDITCLAKSCYGEHTNHNLVLSSLLFVMNSPTKY